MFNEISKGLYKFIAECELMFLMRYKLNPFEIVSSMSLLDLKFYIDMISFKIKEDQDSLDSKGMMKSLMAIRDILNFMFQDK